MTSAGPAVRDTPRGPLRSDAAVGWAAAAATVLVVYVVVVVGGGVLIGRTDSPHLGLSVLATALVAAVVEPVRMRAERSAARRLNRAHSSPYDVLARFSREVEAAETDEQTPAVIARMLVHGTGVAWAQVWLQVGDRLRPVASYPPGSATDLPAPALYETTPRDGVRAVTVAHGRRPLGVLRVREQDGRPLTPVEERLLGGLAAQAGMVLETAQLRAELSARLEQLTAREHELRRARDQLVTTQDLERRRLERDIHDGAQQQLVALAINLKLAKTLTTTDATQARTVLDEQRQATDDAIHTLSDLSSGLLPETLGRQGLAASLTEATAANPVPVRVDVTELRRHSPAVEATLYFCALEAVQNATKHAGASRIDVRLREDRDRLALTVEDDGVGIRPGAGEGTGLANLRERVASLGGELRLGPGAAGGTTVLVDVPVPGPTAAEAG